MEKTAKNFKCRDNTVMVFVAGGADFERTIEEITVGNVYEYEGSKYDQYYEILPDHGTRTIKVPNYCFLPTDEPVTPNPNREQEQREVDEAAQKQVDETIKEREQQRINDNMERYYNPDRFYKKQARRKRFTNAISEVFVQGMPYA